MSTAFDEGASASGVDSEHKTVSGKLIEIAFRAELFHDERGDGYAAMTDQETRWVLRVRSKAFRQWLAHAYYSETGKAANGEALAAALSVCEAKGLFEGALRRLSVRFARPSREELWIDLCDERWRAVRVTTTGWEVVRTPPTLFRRFSHMESLPEPTRGGDLHRVFEYLNVRDEADRVLLLAWLITAVIPDIPRPALALHGPQGSAKTTAARILKALLDPTIVSNLDVGRDPGELALALDHHAVPLFDNVSKIHPWQADRLCAAVTGGGFSKRELYSDADDVIFSFKRAILLTGINVPTSAPDLLDRFLLIGLDRVPSDRRREEAALWEDFDRERAGLLGALLDALVESLHAYPSVRLPSLPRMADFTRWGAAAVQAIGYDQDLFLRACRKNFSGITEEVIESDLVAVAVQALARREGRWLGSVSDLLDRLQRETGESVVKSRDWPPDATRLSKRLRILQATLSEAGVQVGFPEKKTAEGRRAVEIWFVDPAASGTRDTSDDETSQRRNCAGATSGIAPDEAPDPFLNLGASSRSAGAAGANSSRPTVCQFHVGGVVDPCGRCGFDYRSHVQ